MIKNNPITAKQRLKAILIDYLVILVYLMLLFLIMTAFYVLVLKEIPRFTEIQTHWISFLTTVFPTILFFTIIDLKQPSPGKQRTNLIIHYQHKSISAALIRNIIKFLPWQIAHWGIVHGMYHQFNLLSIILMNMGFLFLLFLIGQALFTKNKRHLGDYLAQTQVILDLH